MNSILYEAKLYYTELRDIMEDKFCTYKRVGYFKDKMAQDIGIRFTGTIYASPGVIKHIKNKQGKH